MSIKPGYEGHAKSERTHEEDLELLKKEMDSLSAEEREALEYALREVMDARKEPELYNTIEDLEWVRKPVDIDTFVSDPYYLGNTCDTLYPKLKEDLKELFRDGTYREAVFTGAIGYGKTFTASIGICRLLYELSCMRDPHRSFGLAANSNISVVCLSVNEVLAVKVAYENIATKIEASPYFQEHFPFKKTKKELRFPKQIWVAARATTDSSVLGLNVIGGLLDECVPGFSLLSTSEGVQRVDSLPLGESVNLVTFDTQGVETAAEAFVKRSTVQPCYELELEDGKRLSASGKHPVLTRSCDGDLVFKFMVDTLPGEEVVIYAAQGSEVVGRGERENLGGCEETDGGEESHVWEEALGGSEGANGGGSSKQDGLEALRGNQTEDVGDSEGKAQVRATEAATVCGYEGAMDRGGYGAEAASFGVGGVQSVLWAEAHGRGQATHKRGAQRGHSLRGGPCSDVQKPEFADFGRSGRASHGFVGNDSEGWQVGFAGRFGEAGGRNLGFAIGRSSVRVRDLGSRVSDRGSGTVDGSRFPCVVGGRGDVRPRSESAEDGSQGPRTDRGSKEVLRETRLGPRSLGRTLSVARVVSKRELGVLPTYDISVPGYECFVADGVVVHNTNFMQKRSGKYDDPRFNLEGQAEVLYNAMQRRMKSRFERKGKLPGLLFVVSSKQTHEDFTAKRIRDSKNDPTIFVRDYCLTGDTVVPLLDGTDVPLSELEEKYRNSEDRFEVYSFDTGKGEVVIGRAYRPRITARDEKILAVHLSSGEVFRATSWHPFMLKSGEYCRAGDLKSGDALKTFYDKDVVSVVSVQDGGRADVFDLSVEKYENFAIGSGVFVHNSLWAVKPKEYFAGNWFHVLVGNESTPSRTLSEDEDPKAIGENMSEGCILLAVPSEYRLDFDRDLDGSVRDLAGVATVAVSPYISRREKIESAINYKRSHPFTVMSWDPSQPGKFRFGVMVSQLVDREFGDEYTAMNRPIINPHAARHIHIDPSLRGDATGFVMSHIGGWREITRRSEDGSHYAERAPFIVLDFALQIIPPAGDELQFGDIRRMVYQLTEKGYMITKVTMDSWNSAEPIQKLQQKGYNAEVLSVDRTMAAYECLKNALYENRIELYDYPPLIRELRELEHDRIKRKVDHPVRGSKDVADSLAATVFTLTENSWSQPMPILRSTPMYAGDSWMEEQMQHAAAASAQRDLQSLGDAPKGSGMLPPFLVGSDASHGWKKSDD